VDDSVYVVADSFDRDERTGGISQLINPRPDEGLPTRRAFVWANLMQKLTVDRRLEFRFFAVPVTDEREAQQYVRKMGATLPW
jgi:hypothetical protein